MEEDGGGGGGGGGDDGTATALQLTISHTRSLSATCLTNIRRSITVMAECFGTASSEYRRQY